jgi:hypothetical protein
MARGITFRLLATLILTGLLAAPAAGDHAPRAIAPEMLDPGDPSWEDLWSLELSGALPAGTTNVRPVSRGTAAAWVDDASLTPTTVEASVARLRRWYAREMRRLGATVSERETPPALRLTGEPIEGDPALDGVRSELRIGPSLSLQARGGKGRDELGDSTRVGIQGVLLYSRSVAIQGELWIGEVEKGRSIGDPLIAHTDILYFSENAGITFATSDLYVRLARGRHRWGPGPWTTLLLDAQAPPVDFVEYGLSMPARIRFRSWTGTLNALEKRGIAAHRLDVPIGKNLAIGLSEGARYTGGAGHPLYLIGLLPYTLVQRLDEQDSADPTTHDAQRNNILASIDAVWRPHRGWLTYAEWLVDDLPAATAHTPVRTGVRLGVATLARVAGVPVEVGVEGSKVGRYVYSVDYGNGCECDWAHQGRSLGDPDGPDHEALRMWARRSLGRDHRVEITALIANRGSGRIGDAWPAGGEEWDQPTLDALQLTPPVERTRSVTLRWRWDPWDNLFIDTSATLERTRNAGNPTDNGVDDGVRVSLLAGWRH